MRAQLICIATIRCCGASTLPQRTHLEEESNRQVTVRRSPGQMVWRVVGTKDCGSCGSRDTSSSVPARDQEGPRDQVAPSRIPDNIATQRT
jgi:hypothetical protein